MFVNLNVIRTCDEKYRILIGFPLSSADETDIDACLFAESGSRSCRVVTVEDVPSVPADSISILSRDLFVTSC